MHTQVRVFIKAALAISLAFFVVAPQLADAGDKNDDRQAQEFAKQAKQSAERAEQRERDKGSGTYDIKKTHDEHIPVTEKAAGEADKRRKEKK